MIRLRLIHGADPHATGRMQGAQIVGPGDPAGRGALHAKITIQPGREQCSGGRRFQ